MSDFKINNKRTGRVVTSAAVILFAVIAVFALAVQMRRSIRTSVYSERRELLGRLTESCASIIDDNITYGQSIMDMIADHALHDIPDYDTLGAYIDSVRSRAGYEGLTFFFVDSYGKYMSSDGVSGRITDTTYYTSASADKLSYISNLPHGDAEKSYLIFRNRLPQALRVTADYGESELRYVGILFDIDGLKDTVSQEFAGDKNTFIYDDTTGVMLYKSFGIGQLIEGFNIYPKFSQCEVMFGETPAELEQACRDHKTLVTELRINGSDYYFCSASIAPSAWSVAFLIQSEHLDEMSGSSFRAILIYLTLIMFFLGAAVIHMIVSAYRSSIATRSLHEITELNKDLERATRAKSDFLSNISHDIRTPINGIMGMTAIARGVEGNPARTKDCLEKIDGASHHLLSLINDVLDMSRIEQGRTEIAQKPIDIRMILDNCCSIIRGQMTGRDLQLLSEIDCAHPQLIGDDLHLRQIFINILGNAVKFTKDGGMIRVRCREVASTESEATLAFEFEDTGIGISADFIPKLFDAFTQDEGGARSNYKGTGLGMAITKQLTELMNGTVAVESELGKGTKFTVTIPFLINTAAPEKQERTAEAADITGAKLLLAEDNELNMEIAVEMLEDAGAVITPVTDGKQALEAFADAAPGTFDAILMDVMMPVMNGLEATKAIRALPREDAATIPILAMTANAFESDIQNTREAGMNAHLVKPIDIDVVVRTIAAHIRQK